MSFVREAPPLRRLLRGWPVAAAALSLLAWATPASAGFYNVWPESGSGSVTTTTAGGSSGSRALTDPDIQESVVDGAITYTYTETWRFAWEPESDDYDDLPVDATAVVSATAQFDFTPVSTEVPQSVSGSGSFSLNGYTVSASASFPVSGSPSEVNNGVPMQAEYSHSLSGWEGTFTVTYSGSATASGPLMAQALFAKGGRTVVPFRYIYVVSPSRGQAIPTVGIGQMPEANVTIAGVWKVPFQVSPEGANPAQFRVTLHGTMPVLGTSDPNVSVSWSQPGPVWNPWTWSRSYQAELGGGHRYFNIVAELEWKRANGTWATNSTTSGPRWWSTTWFSVYGP